MLRRCVLTRKLCALDDPAEQLEDERDADQPDQHVDSRAAAPRRRAGQPRLAPWVRRDDMVCFLQPAREDASISSGRSVRRGGRSADAPPGPVRSSLRRRLRSGIALPLPEPVPFARPGSSVLGQVLVHVGRRDELEGNVDLLAPPSRPWRASARRRRAPLPWPAASWNTVTSRSPACIAASASCVASTPPTITSSIDAGRLQRLDRADRHLVVVGDDGVELHAGGQPVGHQVLALRARPVAGLLLDDLHERAFGRGDHVVDVLGALHAPPGSTARPS